MFYKISIKQLADLRKVSHLAVDNKTNNSHYETFKI